MSARALITKMYALTAASMLLILVSFPLHSSAEVPAETAGLVSEFIGPPTPTYLLPSQEVLLARAWEPIRQVLQQKSISGEARSAVMEAIETLHSDVAALGLGSAEQWSVVMLERAENAIENGDRDFAAALATWAERYSPHSARVVLRAARINHLSGVRGFWGQALALTSALKVDRAFLIDAATESAYPLLWAMTFAMFVLMTLTFAISMKAPLRYIGLKLNPRIRWLLTPPIVLAILLPPLWAGPLWTLVLWSFVILLMIPQQRWLCFYAGAVVMLWGIVPPIRETMHHQLADPGVAVFLRASSGVFERDDGQFVQKLAQDKPSDPAVQYVYGMSLKRAGDLVAAREAFRKAEAGWDSEGARAATWAIAQQGLIDFLQGNAAEARKKLDAAAARGLGGVELIVNQSKVSFALTEMDKSLALSREAERVDPEAAADVRAREERFGDQSPLALMEFPLPFTAALDVLLEPIEGAESAAMETTAHLMPKGNPTLLASLGILMISFFFVRSAPQRRIRREILYSEGPRLYAVGLVVKLVPGGTVLWAGLPGLALTILTVTLWLAMPLVGWPSGALGLFGYAPGLQPFFISMFGLWVIGTVYVGWHLKEQQE